MRTLKLAAYIIIGIFVLVITYLVYHSNFSTVSILGKANLAHACKLKVGMSEIEAINIMGSPYAVTFDNKYPKIAHYKSNNGDYLEIEICFDNNNVVKQLFIPEN